MPDERNGQLAAGQWVNGGRHRVAAALAIGCVLALLPWPAGAAEVPALVKARQLYNLGQFAQAAEAALPARSLPATRDAANLIIGRARLELYRQTAAETDLAAARESLRAVKPDALGARDRTELLMGLGEALYFESAFAAAAALFEMALAAPPVAGAPGRERLFDWWAGALDRHAQVLAPEARIGVYPRILEAALTELKGRPNAASAIYWQVAALVAIGEADEAYQAAQAGWVRIVFNPTELVGLRADLDRLVRDGVIPDRARRTVEPDPEQAAEALRAEWERFKAAWTSK